MQQKKAIKNKSEISKIIKKGNKIKNMQPFWEGKKGIEKEEKRDNKKIIKKGNLLCTMSNREIKEENDKGRT